MSAAANAGICALDQSASTRDGYNIMRVLVNYWLSTIKKYPVINELTADHVEANNTILLVLSCANWMSDTAIPRHRKPNSMDPVND
jgi:hypothetical protein